MLLYLNHPFHLLGVVYVETDAPFVVVAAQEKFAAAAAVAALNTAENVHHDVVQIRIMTMIQNVLGSLNQTLIVYLHCPKTEEDA